MSLSQDNVGTPEVDQLGNIIDGCQKADMESNFETGVPVLAKATEEDCVSLTATSEMAKNGDIQRLNNNNGKYPYVLCKHLCKKCDLSQ